MGPFMFRKYGRVPEVSHPSVFFLLFLGGPVSVASPKRCRRFGVSVGRLGSGFRVYAFVA